MSWEGMLVGAIGVLVGLAFAFAGYRFFLILLPIWGFIAGFALTANGIAAILGGGFLSTILGWGAGFFVGLLFAVLSYFFWYVAVIVLAGTVGYAIGGSILVALGFDPGFIPFLAGLALGAVFLIGAIVLSVPKWLIVALTALGGAGAIIVGVAVFIGRVPYAALNEGGLVGAAIGDSLLWALAWVVIAAAGIVVQLRWFSSFELDRSGYRDVTVVTTSYR
jgi:hypothetical protein